MQAIEFINIACPEHGRTSCSDENTWNGFGFEEGDDLIKHTPRCKRCAYLEILRGEIEPELATKFFDENPGWC